MKALIVALTGLALLADQADPQSTTPKPRGTMVIVDDEPEQPPPPKPDCSVPKPSKDGQIIRLGAREGSRISNIAIGGQDDTGYVAVVNIEPGKGPIYIVATNIGPTIWHFTGVTKRVETVVLAGFTGRGGADRDVSGAVGVPRKTVRFVVDACFGRFSESQRGEQFKRTELSDLVLQHVGRRPDGHYSAYRFEAIGVPSMVPIQLRATVPPGFRLPETPETAALWYEHVQHFHGGLSAFRVKDVVAPHKVEPFVTYPYKAGLIQGIDTGAIEPTSVRGWTGYRILKPWQLPAGLNGGYSERFYPAKGVPMPTGPIGHSSLWNEETGVCLKGCR